MSPVEALVSLDVLMFIGIILAYIVGRRDALEERPRRVQELEESLTRLHKEGAARRASDLIMDILETEVVMLRSALEQAQQELGALKKREQELTTALEYLVKRSWELAGEKIEARKRVEELEQKLIAFQGPRCSSPDDECPDHDGEHPYHFNAFVQGHEKGQALLREQLQASEKVIADLRAELADVSKSLENRGIQR